MVDLLKIYRDRTDPLLSITVILITNITYIPFLQDKTSKTSQIFCILLAFRFMFSCQYQSICDFQIGLDEARLLKLVVSLGKYGVDIIILSINYLFFMTNNSRSE